jgi:hypothetical protein
MWLQKSALVLLFISLVTLVRAQVPPPTPIQYPPFPNGMRIVVGGQGVLVRNMPSLTALCGPLPGHDCTAADAVLAGNYGVIQSDPPVFDQNGWWWSNVLFDNAIRGWVSGLPPYINQLQPPQMAVGFPFRVVGDYNGPEITSGVCINDGVNVAGVLNLQAIPGGTGQQGTISCDWGKPAAGNHKAVIQAINNAGVGTSLEFQFAVSTQVVQQVPNTPGNLRIGPADTTLPITQTAKPATAKPTK